MQRVLRIVLIITFMLLLILWFSTIFNTCNKDKTDLESTEALMEDSDSLGVFEDLGDEFFEDGEDVFSEETGTTGDAVTNMGNEGEATDIFETETTDDYTDYTGTTTTPSQSNNIGTSSDDARYLVVAGSFLVKDNAVNMQKKLQNMGYKSEVRNFNFSQYHSVIAGRYNDKASADRTASEIKAKGISCYVHQRQN